MSIPQTVLDLIQRFEDNQQSYRTGQYNEAQTREEFIDPFFEALGWDVRNTAGRSEKYKHVVHEDSIKVRGGTKAPDYAFRIGGQRVFFVEAKKPLVNVKQDTHPAYQLRRYAWSAKLPLSILTDFEEFAVYDCRDRPTANDSAATARVFYLTYQEYPQRWDEIAGIFSPDAIYKGALDRYVESTKVKRGTAEVDAAFLTEIEGWRDHLARNIALRNPGLKVRQLNFAVQKTIDRFIFLRIAEDRGIEPYGRLRDTVQTKDVYRQLGELFRQADNRYNAGLFHFREEKGRETDLDAFTLGLSIDDKILKTIVESLYYPASPYQFDMLPANILGQVYEQFLGKVIRLTPAGRAKVEEKPEVKKAGGVYYTPTYIVDYIVEHTVGELLKDKTYRQTKGSARVAPLRILDPACGSGTFLLQTYQYLMDWYLAQYVDEDVARHERGERLMRDSGGDWRLTSEERKEILLRHIYGVDIDLQAVEVTKLSLLLKVLEGETEATLGGTQLAMSLAGADRVLPDLSGNIRCGNSLIGSDYYENEQLAMDFLDEETMYRINAFDWDSPQGFGKAMAAGGFDAVIGNPPYIRIQAMKQWAPQEVEFYKKQYTSASKGNYDIYVVFVEKGLSLLKQGGRLGYILPHKFFNARYGEALRGLIAQGKHLADVVHFGYQQVFENATTYTCLMFLIQASNETFHFIQVDDLNLWRANVQINEGVISTHKVSSKEWHFVVGEEAKIFDKLDQIPTKLESATDRIFQGLKTGADKVYIVEEREREAGRVKVYSRETNAEHWVEARLVHPLVKGGDSKRYHLLQTKRLILFPYTLQKNGKTEILPEDALGVEYPLTWEYLLDNKKTLEGRERGKMKGPGWYAYSRNQALDVISLPKIFTPDIADHSKLSLDEIGTSFFTGGVAGGYGILVSPAYSREYVLGLLNSRLLEWYIHHTSTQMRGGYYSYESRFIRNLPIRTVDFDDLDDVARHDRMVALVERMLALHRQLAEAKTPQAKRLLQQQIDVTDKAIDQLVYQLYDLTEEEIAIVEG